MRLVVARLAVARLVVSAGLVGLGAEASAQQAFTVVLLPDTQYYCETAAWYPQFTDQTAWAVASKQQRNIAFVSHLGDIVENGANGGNLIEWNRASLALATLTNQIPYSACLGNHDYQVVSDKASGSTNYEAYFGSSRYAGQPWYGGHRNDRSHWQRFSAGGREWVHLNLEWRPDATVLAWAQTIVNANPGVPVLVSTHEHVRDSSGSNGTGAGRSTAGQFTWDNFLRNNPRVVMTFNGHFHSGTQSSGGEYSQIGTTLAGTETHELLTDYQFRVNGGSGLLRTVQFDARNHQIRFQTYSPTLKQFETDFNSQFVVPMDFSQRFDGNTSPAIQTLSFRQGSNGYAGARDTELRQNAADAGTPRHTLAEIGVDSDEPNGSGQDSQVLIRFDGLFGAGAGQIRPDTDVVLARLRMRVVNPGAGLTLHRMLTPWTDSTATWNSLGAGVQANAVEAMPAPEASAGADNSGNNVGIVWVEFDVTSSLRAFARGEANHGWALLPYGAGANLLSFHTSEAAAVADRPQLLVTTATGETRTSTFRNGLNGYAGTTDIEVRQSSPNGSFANAATLAIDSDEPAGSTSDADVLVKFAGLFAGDAGAGPGSLPADAFITSATLIFDVLDTGSGFSLHRMIQPWTSGQTWNSFGTNGPTNDDVEAWIFAEQAAGANNTSVNVLGGPLALDVTETVRAWQQGAANQGWLLRPFASASNGVVIASSENSAGNLRPRLIVEYVGSVPGPCADIDFNNDESSFDPADIEALLSVYAEGPCIPATATCDSIDFNADGALFDPCDIASFLLVFSEGPCTPCGE